MHIAEAFLLLSLEGATLEDKNKPLVTDSTLYLECMTIPPDAQSSFPDRDVYLVIKLGDFETPIDPSCIVTASIRPSDNSHLYSFSLTDSNPTFSVSLPVVPDSPHGASQDLETFNQILTQYVSTFSEQRDRRHIPHHLDQKTRPVSPSADEYEDLRGHLVLVDESDGTVLGELDHHFNINEDPALSRDSAPVVIDLPPDYDSATAVPANLPGQQLTPLTAREAFVRAVPPEERDALMNTASLISHAISATTTLLVSGVTTASKYYVSHSRPHTPSPSPGPPTNQPSGIVISNPRTRSTLTQAHAVSGKAVKVSARTLDVVEGLIKQAAGRKDKPKPQNVPIREEKRSLTPSSGVGPLLPPKPTLRKRDKFILSAEVVFATMEESMHHILDTSSEEITRVVTHKRGEESGQNAALATGTARNVALVYVDLRGFGRKAIIRRFGREYVKGKLSSGNSTRPSLRHAVSNVPTTSSSKPPPPPRHPYIDKK